MKLEIEGRTFERVTGRVDATEGGRLMWRFSTPERKGLRLRIDRRIPEARTAIDVDTQAVRVYSLFWPVAELSAEIVRRQEEKAKEGLVRIFFESLLHQLDSAFPSTLTALKKIQGARRGKVETGRDIVPRELPKETVITVLEILKKNGATPSHATCEKTLRAIAGTLKDAELMPEECGVADIDLVVKRLALKYDTITPEPNHTGAVPRFAMMHADSVEDGLFQVYKALAVKDRSEDKADADGYGFQAFLSGVEYVAIVEGWPSGHNSALPVIAADTEPQEITDAASEAQIVKDCSVWNKKEENTKQSQKKPRKKLADSVYTEQLIAWLNETRPKWVKKQRKINRSISWPTFKENHFDELCKRGWNKYSPQHLKGCYDVGRKQET